MHVILVLVMATMDTTESRRPQDGQLSIHEAGGRVNFRVSTIPTIMRVWTTPSVMTE